MIFINKLNRKPHNRKPLPVYSRRSNCIQYYAFTENEMKGIKSYAVSFCKRFIDYHIIHLICRDKISDHKNRSKPLSFRCKNKQIEESCFGG